MANINIPSPGHTRAPVLLLLPFPVWLCGPLSLKASGHVFTRREVATWVVTWSQKCSGRGVPCNRFPALRQGRSFPPSLDDAGRYLIDQVGVFLSEVPKAFHSEDGEFVAALSYACFVFVLKKSGVLACICFDLVFITSGSFPLASHGHI